jgi:hypothetical protein
MTLAAGAVYACNEKAALKIPRRSRSRLGRPSNSRKSVKRLGSATSP